MPPGVTHSNRTRILALACLGLIVFEGFLALAWMFTQPVDPDSTFLLGYSPVRWALAGMILLLTGLAGTLGIDLLRNVKRPWQKALARRLDDLPAVLVAGSLGLLAVNHGTLLALAPIDHTAVRAVFNRLLPVGVFVGLASLQVLLAAGLSVKQRTCPDHRITRAAGLAWIGLVLAGGLVLLTRLGLDPVTNGWYEYGTPLAHQQVLYLFYSTLLILLAGLVVSSRLPSPPWARKALDMGLLLAIWLAAVIVWNSMPVPDSWFSPKPLPPNHEVYPNSDALSYDLAAQGTLLGTAWSRGAVHYKPFYVAILTLLHAAAGQDYTRVVFLQTLLLALFPASLYLLGRSLHSRLAGGLAGLAAILREYNQLTVASLTTLSNSKLLLSELPTALGISALLVVLAAWLRSPGQRDPAQRPYLALLAGGMIGLLIEIRLQTILLLPALAALLFLLSGKRWRSGLAAAGLVCLGIIMSTSPLALRNWSISGTLTLEKPGYFERTLSYAYTPVSAEEDPNEPFTAAPPGETNPGLGKTLELALHHFAHNAASTLLVMPNGLGSETGWTRLRDLQSLFWTNTRAVFRLPGAAWILANLALLALGAAALWRQAGWAGLLPALFFAVYNLSSALGGFSGQRFILPVDWVGYFYALTGLAWLAVTLLGLLGWNVNARLPFWTQPSPTHSIRHSGRAVWLKTAVVIGILLLAGGLLPLEEALIPVRQPGAEPGLARAELLHLAEAQLSPQEMGALQALLDRPGSEVLQGIALYPRAIASEELEAGILRYRGERTYPLLAYVYLGSEQLWVLQPLEGLDGVALPNGAEVLVAGTRSQGSFQAFATARLDGSSFLFHPANK